MNKQDYTIRLEREEEYREVENLVRERFPQLQEIAFRFGMFQRLEYLLHIPVSKMNKETAQYPEVCGYVRKNCIKAWKNSYLTTKNKVYLTLFAIAPKTIRVVHKRIKRL